jgi:hypothetical protein
MQSLSDAALEMHTEIKVQNTNTIGVQLLKHAECPLQKKQTLRMVIKYRDARGDEYDQFFSVPTEQAEVPGLPRN